MDYFLRICVLENFYVLSHVSSLSLDFFLASYCNLECLLTMPAYHACFLADFLFCTYVILYILYMMTSVSSDRSRGSREKTQISGTQASQLQKQVVQVSFCETLVCFVQSYVKQEAHMSFVGNLRILNLVFIKQILHNGKEKQ